MKPTEFPRFAVNNLNNGPAGEANVIEPSPQQIASGWLSGQYPPRQTFNWMHRLTYQWLEWTVAQHGNIFDPRDYGDGEMTGTNISLACTAALAANGIVVIKGGTYIIDNFIADFQNVPLLIEPGSLLNLETNSPSNINLFGDPRWQVFITDEPVDLNAMSYIRPDWFFHSNVDNTQALTLAIRSCSGSGNQYVLIDGILRINSSIDIGGNSVVHLKGANAQLWCGSISPGVGQSPSDAALFNLTSGFSPNKVILDNLIIKGYASTSVSDTITDYSSTWYGVFTPGVSVYELLVKDCTILGSRLVNANALLCVGIDTTILNTQVKDFAYGRAIASNITALTNHIKIVGCKIRGVREALITGFRNFALVSNTTFEYCVNIGIGSYSNTRYINCVFKSFGRDRWNLNILPVYSHGSSGTISTAFYDEYGLVSFDNCHFDSSEATAISYFTGVFEGYSDSTRSGSATFTNCTRSHNADCSGSFAFFFFMLLGYRENMYRLIVNDPATIPERPGFNAVNCGILYNTGEARYCDEGTLFLRIAPSGIFSTRSIYAKIAHTNIVFSFDKRMTLTTAPEYFSIYSLREGSLVQYIPGDKAIFQTPDEGDLECVCTVAGYGAPKWLPYHSYAVMDLVQPTIRNGFIYRIRAVDGITDGAEPVWPTIIGQTVGSGYVYECYTVAATWEYTSKTKPAIARYAHYDGAPTNYDYSTEDGYLKLGQDKIAICKVYNFTSLATVTVTEAIPGCHLYLVNGEGVGDDLRIWHCLSEGSASAYTIVPPGEGRHFICTELVLNSQDAQYYPKLVLIQ